MTRVVFEKNVGQLPPAYYFLSRQSGAQIFFFNSGLDIFLPRVPDHRIGLHLIGSRADVLPQPKHELATVTNYLLGKEPSSWVRNVANYEELLYPEIYSGIDLVFHGRGDALEHDFRIQPGTSPDQIHLLVSGADKVSIAGSGDLEASTQNGLIALHKPIAYQESADGRKSVNCSFVLAADNSVRFQVGAYDHARELVIDPVFTFSTYLAGNTQDVPTAVAADSTGNIYVTGYTYSSDFPIANPLQGKPAGSPNVFVSKLDPTGHTLLFSTYIGGAFRNYGSAIAVDGVGNIIVAGTSSSNDFPHVGSVPALTCEGNNDCFFVASIKPDGSAFNYAGLIGGIEGTAVQTGESGSGVLALDASGNAYLAGVTDDANFEITPGTLTTKVPGYPINSTFVMKVGKTGALAYSTIVPGKAAANPAIFFTNVFIPNGITVNSSGYATIAGTAGPGLPSTAGVVQPTFPNSVSTQNPSAGFLLQLNALASAIRYATYVPGTDQIGGLAVDASGNNYVTGGTSETNLPVSTNAYQKTMKAGPNCTCNSGFIAKLNGSGTAILAASYLEGTPGFYAGTSFTGIALDSHSNVFVGGMTASTDFPLLDPFVRQQLSGETTEDMILAGMSPDLSTLRFGSFLSSTDQVFPGSEFSAITVDHQNNLIVTGATVTTDFPTTAGAFQPTPPAQSRHPFVSKLNMAVAAPSVCLDNWSLSFGLVPAKTSSTQTVHLKNSGDASLTIASTVSSAATVKATNTCGTMQPGIVCPLSVTYSPKDSSAVTGSIALNDNTVISPQVIGFSGQGLAGQLSPSSGSVDFGHLLVNTTGAGNPLFFTNTGTAPLQITSASVNGDFFITQNFCINTFQPNDLCSVTVKFSPKAAGIRTGTLTIVSNDPLHPRAGISLKGVGDTVYTVPIISSLGSPTAQIKNGPITVQVGGANFYPASVVEVNGQAQPTTYVSGQALQATLQSSVASAIGEVSVRVFNPAPGGGTSVAVPLTRYQVVNVNAAFLTTVPGSTTLYASVPASDPTHPNTVIPINPVSGTLGIPIPVGKDPSLLASSSDGSYLFVVLNQDQTVQRINLATKSVDRTFPFPPNSTTCCGALSATDLKGIPGTPEEVVLALDIPYYGFGEMALYNDKGLVNHVPTSSPLTLSFSSFAFAGSPLAIYSLPFTTAQNPFFNITLLNSSGLEFLAPPIGNYGGNNTTGAQVASDGTLLYTNSGEIWSPTTKTQVGSFPVTTDNATSYPNLHTLLLETATGHIFVLGDQLSGIVLSAYGHKSHALSGALAFPQVVEPLVFSLVRWGTNGFAFLSQQSPPSTLLVNTFTSSLANPITANPVPVLHSLAPSSATKGSQPFQLTINGSGFTEASVVKWNAVSLRTTFVANGVLTAYVWGSLLSNSGSASVTVVSPAPGGGTSNSLSFIIATPAPLISFSSSKIAFPTEVIGTSTVRSVAVQNPGTAPLTLSGISVGGLNAAAFHESNNCGTTLLPGANCTLWVTFKPTSVGTLIAFVSFSDNASGSPHTVALTGTGQ